MREVKNLATVKAKKMVERVTTDLKKLFEGEYRPLVEQYNEMRFMLAKHELDIKSKDTKQQVLEQLNAAKDTFYDALPVKYIDLIPDIDFKQPSEMPPLSLEEVTSMNRTLN